MGHSKRISEFSSNRTFEKKCDFESSVLSDVNMNLTITNSGNLNYEYFINSGDTPLLRGLLEGIGKLINGRTPSLLSGLSYREVENFFRDQNHIEAIEGRKEQEILESILISLTDSLLYNVFQDHVQKKIASNLGERVQFASQFLSNYSSFYQQLGLKVELIDIENECLFVSFSKKIDPSFEKGLILGLEREISKFIGMDSLKIVVE